MYRRCLFPLLVLFVLTLPAGAQAPATETALELSLQDRPLLGTGGQVPPVALLGVAGELRSSRPGTMPDSNLGAISAAREWGFCRQRPIPDGVSFASAERAWPHPTSPESQPSGSSTLARSLLRHPVSSLALHCCASASEEVPGPTAYVQASTL